MIFAALHPGMTSIYWYANFGARIHISLAWCRFGVPFVKKDPFHLFFWKGSIPFKCARTMSDKAKFHTIGERDSTFILEIWEKKFFQFKQKTMVWLASFFLEHAQALSRAKNFAWWNLNMPPIFLFFKRPAFRELVCI